MALAERHRSIALYRVIVLVVLAMRVFSLEAERIRRNVENPIEPITLSLVIGEPARMVYKPTDPDFAASALKFGHWKKNNSLSVQTTDNIVVGIGRNKKRFWLKIGKVDIDDSGLYSFMVNGTVVKQWLLQIQVVDSSQEPCGKAAEDPMSSCIAFSKFSHPNCQSFPGPPLNVKVSSHSYKGSPVIQVSWLPPNTGFNDLWGYQLYITGKDNHPGHSACHQINRKEEILYWTFKVNIRYGATYRITVQSMPSNHKNDKNLVFQDVKVPEMCQFEDYMNLTECCSIINITAKYTDNKIHLNWTVPLQEQCQRIRTFLVKWNNIQKPEECHGQDEIKEGYEYIIYLKKEVCMRFNYSIKLSGKIGKRKTKDFKKTVLIPPQPPQPPPSPQGIDEKPMDASKKILIAVLGAFLGLFICSLLVMYRIFFWQVRIKLPDHPSPRPYANDPLLESDKKRVFIMYTRCCEKCNHVVHCFGAVLNSTELIEASIDMWNTLDIAPNVPRWYEDQVKNSHCVVVLASHKMSVRCHSTVEEGDDPLNIRCQLNLIRGQIAQNPDVHRFIPAFFTCSGTKKNIPEFLSSRWSHKLPKEVDRVIFHLLNVEKIQPYRTQPIIVMGGNGHPFDEKKKELERAVQEAETYHRNNNLQNV